MPIIIKGRKLRTDFWRRLEPGADGSLPGQPSGGDLIVPLAAWRAQREALIAREGRIGLWVDGDEEPEAFAPDLELFGVIAVNFPKFTDGRGYSLACLLRNRYGYRGELRATGDIYRDHLYFLESCGFDAFALREGEDPEEALAAFEPFSEPYQNSVARPLPLFRRRHPAAAGGASNA